MSEFIEVTITSNMNGMADQRLLILKKYIQEVYENTRGGCFIHVLRGGEWQTHQVKESFNAIKALIQLDPAVADIVIKGELS